MFVRVIGFPPGTPCPVGKLVPPGGNAVLVIYDWLDRIIEMPDGNKKRKTEVIAEKITFLSSSQRKADNSERETKITEEKRKADE